MPTPVASPRASIERLSGRLSLTRRGTPRKSRTSRHGAAREDGVDEWKKSPSERESAIAALRAALRKAGYTQEFDSNTLIRFLRARDYDIAKATAMFITHLKWRKENNVDTILDDFDFKERDQYLGVYPQGYYNTDKQGRPMTIQHLGQVKPKRINEITTEDRMVKYHIQEYERFLKKMVPVCSALAGRHIDQSFAVLDVKGVSVGMLSGDVRKVLNRIMSIAQDHYPETMGETIIVNAPVSFRFVWNLIRPMLQPRTVNKITLLGAKYYDELTKRVEPDAIPSYMGGNCQKTLLEDPGPWNDERVADLRDIDERPSDDGGGLDPEMGGGTPVAAHDLSSRIGGATPVAAHDFSSRMDGATPVAAHDNSSRMDGMPSASAALSKADSGDIKSLGGGRSSMENGAASASPRVAAHQGHALSRPSGQPGAVGQASTAPLPAAMRQSSQATAHSLFERVQALERQMRERGGALEGSAPLPSAPPTSLLARVQLLESGMTALIQAQEAQVGGSNGRTDPEEGSKGCCCCAVM